jgi:hypothetical protein
LFHSPSHFHCVGLSFAMSPIFSLLQSHSKAPVRFLYMWTPSSVNVDQLSYVCCSIWCQHFSQWISFQSIVEKFNRGGKPVEQIPSSELVVPHIMNKIPALNGTRIFITVFTTARHLSLHWAT